MRLEHCTDSSSVPDIFVTVKENKEKLFFMRVSASRTFANTDPQYKVYPLMIDRSTNDKLLDYQAGYIRLRVGMFDSQNPIPSDWKKPTGKPEGTPIIVIANLFRGYELASSDEDGLSDAFVEFDHHGSVVRSKVDPSTLDPVWNERVVIPTFTLDNVIVPLLITVFDRDPEGQEFMGRAVCDLPTQLVSKDQLNVLPPPKTVELQYSDKIKIGKLLVSFQTVAMIENIQRELRVIEFPKESFIMKFKLLGVRNLQASGVLPVKKPYLKLNTTPLRGEAATGNTMGVMVVNSKQGNENASFAEVLQ